MRMTKKITSIVLAVLMVVSMVSVMAVTTASAATVAKIGDDNYETLESAFAHAQDGDTITVVADSAGNGIFVSPNTFNGTGLTVDFAGHTYTIDATLVGSPNTQSQAFHLEQNNKITLKNGTIYSEKARMLVQNYCDLTLDNMTLTPNNSSYSNYYTLSNNNGNVVINDTTINANPAGGYAFDVCRYSSYPSVNVTVKGNSVINGDVQMDAENGDPKNGFSLTLESGTMAGEVKKTAGATSAITNYPAVATVTTEPAFVEATPVAQIGAAKFATLEDAWNAAQDGATIKLLANSAGNGLKAPQGKFATGLTVDFNGYTYTVDGSLVGSTGTQTQAFQLLMDNTITFKNGTIYSENAKMLVQNYSNLTLDKMVLTLNNPNYAYAYTLSNNNGNVVIDDTTINANPAGKFAFDVCRFASYPSVNVTVTGDSEINGNVEVDAGSGDAKNGFSLTLESGELNGDIKLTNGAKTAMDATPAKAEITKASTFAQDAPEGYVWVNDGSAQTLAKAVAKIGDTPYATLEAAWNAAADGNTITLLADCAGNGLKAPQGKYTTGLTVDFGGFTYTVNGTTVGSTGTETQGFQLLKDNKITFKNGAITGSSRVTPTLMFLIQNYSDLTLDDMDLSLTGRYYSQYTLSNNNGEIVIKDSEINAPDYSWAGLASSAVNSFAFDVCRGGGSDTYPSVNVTVTGDSVINGDVEVYAKNSDPKDGFSLTLESGTMNGDIVMDQTAQNVIDTAPSKIKVTKKSTFDQAAPENFVWKDNGDGTQSLVLDNPLVPDMITAAAAKAQDGNKFGLTCNYLKGTLLGVQKKEAMIDDIPGSDITSESHQEGQKNIRFVAVLDTDLIQAMQGADDYGFVLAKVSTDKTYSDKIENIKYGMESAKTISAKDTYNNVCGNEAYGDPTDTTGHTDYKYITCAVNNIDDTSKIVARFYYKKGDKVYYAKYAGHNYQYTGCISTANATA